MGNTKQARLDGGVKTRVGHWRKDPHDVYIGRDGDGDTKQDMANTPIGERGWLGNPYPKDDHGRETCVELFREDFEQRLESDAEFRAAVADLAGKTLGCWCQRLEADGPLCHGEIIAEHANRLAGESDE